MSDKGKPMSDRPETGPMQFGDDWPGTFIRGDNAFHFALHLERLLELTKDMTDSEVFYAAAVVRGLLSELQGSREPAVGCQKLRPWAECQPHIPCSGCGSVVTGPHACPGHKTGDTLDEELQTVHVKLRPFVETGEMTLAVAKEIQERAKESTYSATMMLRSNATLGLQVAVDIIQTIARDLE